MDSKIPKLIEKEARLAVARGVGKGNWDEGGQKVQTSTFKINKYWDYNVQHGDCELTLRYGGFES